nr:alpha-L-iduronidase-like isoform X2 [Dermacentor andersoni]
MCRQCVEMLAVVVLLLCKAIVTESTCLDSDILYVRRLDGLKQITSKNLEVFINASDVVGIVKPFWKSTGFCPPEPHNDPAFFLGDDMQQNLIYIASVPGYGTTQVRMHWLLDIVNANTSSETGGRTTFDFSLLDTLLDRLRALGLKPGLELMGNPFPRPLDFEERADLDLWKELVAAMARHYLDRYDEDYVTQWNFESWNEPDHKGYGSNFTEQGLCNYYDACSEGLNEASPLLRLGGPAENLAPRHRSPLAWALLDHCERGARLDFISIHQKGNASTGDIVEAEMEALSRIRERCPSLSTKPCINNEADPIKNWAEPFPWRADATYAAMLARLVKSHLAETGSCESLSSDNGFLSYPPQPFSQRTQLARFRMNLTEPHVLFVRKPVHAVQALLGKLASRAVSASARAERQDDHGEPGPQLDVIATASGSYSLSALLYYSNESTWEPGVEAKVSVHAELDWSTASTSSWRRATAAARTSATPTQMLSQWTEDLVSAAGKAGGAGVQQESSRAGGLVGIDLPGRLGLNGGEKLSIATNPCTFVLHERRPCLGGREWQPVTSLRYVGEGKRTTSCRSMQVASNQAEHTACCKGDGYSPDGSARSESCSVSRMVFGASVLW